VEVVVDVVVAVVGGVEVVVVVVVVVSQTLALQTCPVGQSPQFSVSGQLPSMIKPHCAPSGVHDEGVQHCPFGRFPGGWLLTQTRPQQLWFVRHAPPSAMQGPAPTTRGQLTSAAIAMIEAIEKHESDRVFDMAVFLRRGESRRSPVRVNDIS
jgi:hypothetical protein